MYIDTQHIWHAATRNNLRLEAGRANSSYQSRNNTIYVINGIIICYQSYYYHHY